MRTFIRCDAAGVSDDKKRLIFQMTANDGHDYGFEITHGAFLELFAACWARGPSLTGGIFQAQVLVPASKVRVSLPPAASDSGLEFHNGPLQIFFGQSRHELQQLLDVLQYELARTEPEQPGRDPA